MLWREALTDTVPERQREAPSAGGPQSLQAGMAWKIGNSQEVQHRLAVRRSTTLLPFPLSSEPTRAEIYLSMVGAREKPIHPELICDAARRLESDPTRWSLPRGTVC